MKVNPFPTLEYLENIFEVDETSPSGLRWKNEIKSELLGDIFLHLKKLIKKLGQPAGRQHTDGRWSVVFFGYKLYVHRIVYALYNKTVDLGKLSVDHIDGNSSNNNPSNLRLVSHSQNMKNRKMSKRNKTGVKGVTFSGIKKPYRVQIVVEWKHIQLGNFSSIYEARDVYEKAAKEYHGDFASFTTLEELEKFLSENEIIIPPLKYESKRQKIPSIIKKSD